MFLQLEREIEVGKHAWLQFVFFVRNLRLDESRPRRRFNERRHEEYVTGEPSAWIGSHRHFNLLLEAQLSGVPLRHVEFDLHGIEIDQPRERGVLADNLPGADAARADNT